jgi:hypothetical protein
MPHYFRSAKSQRRMLAVAITALVGAIPAGASAATVSHTSFKGEHAYAAFAGSSPDGCVHTLTEVSANDGRTKDEITGHTSSSTAEIAASVFDECRGLFLFYLGSSDLSRDQFTVGRTSAALTATVPTQDIVTGTTATYAISLAWTATGQPTTTRTVEHSAADGSRSVFRAFGSFGDASATGTVSSGGANLAASPSSNASIGSANYGILLITRP